MSERKFVPYVRVKRRHQTVFVEAQPGDTFLSVKEQLGALFGLAPSHIQLWQGLKDSKELSDVATLADHDVQNDQVLFMCWKKENSDQWEELSVAKADATVGGGDGGGGGGATNGAKAE
ncbi:hypothetical protein P43SY_004535 [Pythium insidiosum]|uniref:Ubiquitin-like domain-containing protein n=1 Tax=Pythium insidiosum TaxID=114742 RepID=A0AAD5LQY7_PYTIN|nr:hypothetical protein P43SY_004535 [Pythium insidiosum]KAJ0410891.1 hypothetical protein ATCC90586_004412 [Pythium insidiosum]